MGMYEFVSAQINKHKYCMAKDDIVLGLGRPMYGSSVYANRKKAYPSVITTLGQMEKEARQWIALHNFLCRSYLDADRMKKRFVGVMCADNDSKLDANDKILWKTESIKVVTMSLVPPSVIHHLHDTAYLSCFFSGRPKEGSAVPN